MSKVRLIIVVFLTLMLDLALLPLCSNHLLHGVFSGSSVVARVDIYNRGNIDNSLDIVSQNENTYPEWCKNDKGRCVVVNEKAKKNWKEYIISAKAVNSGELQIVLRGPDKRIENERYPVVVDYRNFRVNGKEIFGKRKRVWHDKPFSYKLKVKDGEVVNISFWARKHHFKVGDITKVYQTNLLLLFTLTVLAFLFSYKLVQYVAKFKILEAKSRIDIVFLFVFFVLLFVPMSNISTQDKSNKENRMLTPKPTFLNNNGINPKFGDDFEKWFNDRFWGRDLAIKLNGMVKYKINRVYRNAEAFYFKDTKWAHVFNDLKVLNGVSFRKEDISSLIRVDEFCKENGIKLYLLLLPNKENVYADDIKEKLGGYFPEMSASVDVVYELGKYIDGRIVFPYNQLIEAKKDDYVFFKVSHHWTEWGAFVGYKALMERIKEDFPDIEIASIGDFDKSYSKQIREDWARDYGFGHTVDLLNIDKRTMEKDVLNTEYSYYEHKDRSNMYYKKVDCKDKKAIKDFRYNKGKYKLFLTGNSQNENLLQFLPYSFAEVKYIRANKCVTDEEHYKLMKRFRADILAFKPDIMVINVYLQQFSLLANFFKD